jgi:hypothetical protein
MAPQPLHAPYRLATSFPGYESNRARLARFKGYTTKKRRPVFDLKKNEVDMALFRSETMAAWEAIPEGLIRRLILSMGDRLRAVIAARGWYTHY